MVYATPLSARKGIMDTRILELALEALQVQKAKLEAEIEQVRRELRQGPRANQTGAAPKRAIRRRRRSAAERKAQSERMRAYWANKKQGAGKTVASASTARARKKAGNMSAAARKAVSERMKAYWAKRRKERKG